MLMNNNNCHKWLFIPGTLLLTTLILALVTGANLEPIPDSIPHLAGLPLKIIGPTSAPVGSPVSITISGIPSRSSIETVKHGFSDDDTFLELYQKDGSPVNVFWSQVAGKRSLIVFGAINGEEVPETAVAYYTLEYNGFTPDPKPIPNSNPVPEPSSALKAKVGSLLSYIAAGDVSHTDIVNVATFYLDFADAVKNNSSTIKTTADFRAVYVEAGKESLDLKGKYAGFGASIDKVIMSVLGNQVIDFTPIMRTEIAETFQAIAWALYEGDK